MFPSKEADIKIEENAPVTENYFFHLLAPEKSFLTSSFESVQSDFKLHGRLLESAQTLRGKTYLEDGAIRGVDLDCQGRFNMPRDDSAWHLLLLNSDDDVIGCVRFLLHDPSVQYEELNASHSAIAKDLEWGPRIRQAVESDLQKASERQLKYVEIGGWALMKAWRNTRAALEMMIASFALGSLWGGCLGYCTATVRHSSSSMLRRMGGESFLHDGTVIPSYHESNYGCNMELLRFDYQRPATRFRPLITPLLQRLAHSNVTAKWQRQSSYPGLSETFEFLHLIEAMGPDLSVLSPFSQEGSHHALSQV